MHGAKNITSYLSVLTLICHIIRSTKLVYLSEIVRFIVVVTRSKTWVCDRSLAGIAGSNPARHGRLFLVSVVCCQVEICTTG
jgi:hypothetical protein